MIVLLRQRHLQFFQTIGPHMWPHLFRRATNGTVKQASSPYNPKYLLLKMPYRFNTSYQLLARTSEYVRCDRFLSLDLQRSQP
jgi:hypothetical protein